MDRIQIDEAKTNFEDVIKLVANAKQRIIVADDGREFAAFIPLEDLALLERLDGDVNIPVERVPDAEVLRHLEDDRMLVSEQAQRIVVKQGEEELVALVPQRDLSRLQNLDDRLDIEAAKRLLQRELEEEDE